MMIIKKIQFQQKMMLKKL